jgi:hypothetical protein
MIPEVWLRGHIAEGRRVRLLGMTLQAQIVDELPEKPGAVIVTGEDFMVAENRPALYDWVQEPGRLLLVVPPMQIGTEATPFQWSVEYSDSSPKGGTGLAALLSSEVKYKLRGDLLTDHINNMQFAEQTLAVGYHRPRISTGILAITVLPIWSVRTIDHPEMVQDWIQRIYELAGAPRQAKEQVQDAPILTPFHYTIMIHLSSHLFETQEAALDSLEKSAVFNISKEQSAALYEDLVQLGFIKEAKLTQSGDDTLRASPYAIYIDALKETSL